MSWCVVKSARVLHKRGQVARLVSACTTRPELARYGTLFLLAYAFLLRLPSEALPAVGGKGSGQSAVYRDGDTLVLELTRR